MKKLKLAALLLTGIVCASASYAQQSKKTEKTVMVGRSAVYPSKKIVENAVNSRDHTNLVAAVNTTSVLERL